MNATKTESRAFTLKQALAYVKSEEYIREDWREAERVITAAGLCTHCASDGVKSRLGPWEPGNPDEYAGRTCYVCEEFYKCGDQPEYDHSPDCFSDADPGL